MKNNVINILKQCNASLYHDNGIEKSEIDGILKKSNTRDEYVRLLKEILITLRFSDDINEFTKEYIFNSRTSIQSIVDTSDKYGKKLTYPTVLGKVHHDNDVLSSVISTDTLRDIISHVDNSSMTYEELCKNVDSIVKRFNHVSNSRTNIILNINNKDIINNADKENFFSILDTIKMYVRDQVNIIEDTLNKTEFAGYFNYLLSDEAANDESVKEDRDRLVRFLYNFDYSNDNCENNITSDEDSEAYLNSDDAEEDTSENIYDELNIEE